MIRIEDQFYDRAHFEAASARFLEQVRPAEHPGTRYAVCFPNTVDWLALFFAIRAADATVLPIHPSTPHAAARRLAEAAGCHVLFYHGLVAEPVSADPPRPGEGQLLQMSSGTTGAPKCVARGWTEIRREVETYVQAFREPEDMTPVIACPITHSYGLICGILVALERGQTPIIVNTGNPKHLLKVLAGIERPLLYSSPAILHALARLQRGNERLHAVMTSGTLLPGPWFDDIRARTLHMFQQYGCSEAGCIAVNPDVAAADDMGRPLPHLSVTAGEGAGSPGEIIVRGPEGIIRTRDLGYRKPDGTLVFVARLDDTINVSGLNVYPKEVEDVVMAIPAVTDAVAFRMTDRFAGERVGVLFSAAAPVSMADMRDWCSRNLAAHQVPTEVVQINAVPRQANGKISRREIAQLHAEGRLRPVSMEHA